MNQENSDDQQREQGDAHLRDVLVIHLTRPTCDDDYGGADDGGPKFSDGCRDPRSVRE
jgi:hypothetical protein